jgi:hypothetical protein
MLMLSLSSLMLLPLWSSVIVVVFCRLCRRYCWFVVIVVVVACVGGRSVVLQVKSKCCFQTRKVQIRRKNTI